MNTCKTEASFSYLKMQKNTSRGFIKSSVMIRVKNKPISKKKCHQNCTNHLFSLRKIEPDLFHQINKDISDVSLSFCPIFDHCLDVIIILCSPYKEEFLNLLVTKEQTLHALCHPFK